MGLLLAVSGGVDSMYMAENFLRKGIEFAVAHCNFNLRGHESDSDESFVREWCGRNSIKSYFASFDTAAYASEKGISIEMAARELRYEWFAKLCLENGFEGVAVAHNANDNAETLLLNIIRGTGGRGLRGMKAVGIVPGAPDVKLFRPILKVSRKEIDNWMITNGLQHREDSTNASTLYKRNAVRHEIIPVMERLNPSFLKTASMEMERFTQENDIAEEWYREHREAVLGNDGRILIGPLQELKHWKYMLYRLCEGHMAADAIENLSKAVESGVLTSGKRYGEYITTSDAIVPDIRVCSVPGIEVEVVEMHPGFNLKRDDGSLLFDAALMPSDFKIRPWKEGDWMVPFGMKGKKKLSDMFVDMKYSLVDKKGAFVIEYPSVEAANGRVAALLWQRTDDSLKVTSSTSEILIIKPTREA